MLCNVHLHPNETAIFGTPAADGDWIRPPRNYRLGCGTKMKSISLRIGLVLVLVCGAFLVYGFYILVNFTPAEPNVTASTRGTGTEEFRALFEREVKLASAREAED